MGIALCFVGNFFESTGRIESSVTKQTVAHSLSSLLRAHRTEIRIKLIEKETLTIVHAFKEFDQLLFGKGDITVHTNHKPLEAIFKRSLALAPRRLQSMLYSFRVKDRKGFTLVIADTLSQSSLPMLLTTITLLIK